MDATPSAVRPDRVSDALFPFESRVFAEPKGHRMHFADAEIHESDDCGHFLAEEAPERVLPLLRDFLGRE